MTSIAGRVLFKLEQFSSFVRDTKTPISLILDALRLKLRPFIAISHDGLKLKLAPRRGESFTFFENMVRRDYLPCEISLSPGGTVVDIGANIGSFTVLAASVIGATGRVLSFEPVPETFARLQNNIRLNNLENVTCKQVAVEAENGTIRFHATKKSANSGAHVNRRELKHAIDINVPTVTLEKALIDSGIKTVNLLKIDCEGSEYSIFENMTKETAGKIEQIVMEVHVIEGRNMEALAVTLSDLGFDVFRHNPLYWIALNQPLPI